MIATTGAEHLGAGELGDVYFTLTKAGQTMLSHAHGNQLAADVTLTDGANTASGQIACRFHARDLNLVMGPAAPQTPMRCRVLIDGQPPGEAHGSDVDRDGNGTVTQQRVYQLIRQPGPITDHTFEITFPDPGVQTYCFTFG